MINDNMKLIGAISSWKLLDSDGKIKQEGNGPNLITTVGKNLVAQLLGGTSTTTMGFMGIGSSSTSPSTGDTALIAQTARVAFSSTTVSTNNVIYVASFGPGVGTGVVAEAGLFSASTGGTMLSRSTAVNLNKGAGDTLQITWTVTFN